ncbi:MAG: peptide chain release factor N(5)-glutamine methyltransferase [Rhodospirillales bacterium]|nr:peptide chain release factor N(5)-glutamine methyltransferase [Rhodospirillales bacterium]
MSETVPDTAGALLLASAWRLRSADIPNPRSEARLLLGHALGLGVEALIARPDLRVPAAAREAFERAVRRRAGREPLAVIVGHREFWSLSFRVTADTLVPRPESETLVEAALAAARGRDRPITVLDLGAGSGCLVLAILHERPAAWGVGVDRSDAALFVARNNADALGIADRVAFVQGDWGTAIGGRFDIIVANPPYVADAEFAVLAPEVARFEPRLALCGGADGLDAYRALAPDVARLLAPDGVAVLEVGAGQAAAVAAILADHYLQVTEIKNDLAGVPRCLRAAPAPVGISKKKLGNQEVPD